MRPCPAQIHTCVQERHIAAHTCHVATHACAQRQEQGDTWKRLQNLLTLGRPVRSSHRASPVQPEGARGEDAKSGWQSVRVPLPRGSTRVLGEDAGSPVHPAGPKHPRAGSPRSSERRAGGGWPGTCRAVTSAPRSRNWTGWWPRLLLRGSQRSSRVTHGHRCRAGPPRLRSPPSAPRLPAPALGSDRGAAAPTAPGAADPHPPGTRGHEIRSSYLGPAGLRRQPVPLPFRSCCCRPPPAAAASDTPPAPARRSRSAPGPRPGPAPGSGPPLGSGRDTGGTAEAPRDQSRPRRARGSQPRLQPRRSRPAPKLQTLGDVPRLPPSNS